MRCKIGFVLLAVGGLLLANGSAWAQNKAEKPPAKPPGPAKKMKVITFVTLQTQGILKLQFLDAANKPTKAPEGGEITYRTNITKPRTGKISMTQAKWKPKEKLYVFQRINPRQRYVCPPRTYWIRVNFKAGRKRFSAYKNTKFNCL